MFTGSAVFPAGQRATEFQPSLGRFRTIMVHFSAYFADGNAIFPDGEIILIFTLLPRFTFGSIRVGCSSYGSKCNRALHHVQNPGVIC